MDARDLGGLATGDREEEMGAKADSKGKRCGQAGSPHSWGLWEHRAFTPVPTLLPGPSLQQPPPGRAHLCVRMSELSCLAVSETVKGIKRENNMGWGWG